MKIIDIIQEEIKTIQENIVYDELLGILKEWEDDSWDQDWIHDIYEMRDEIMRETIYDFMGKPPTAKQPWKVVPFPRLKKIWEDAAKMGVVRDTRGLQEIQERMVRNLLKLDVNTELLGHQQSYPDEETFEDAGTTKEAFEEKLNDWSNVYFSSPNGQHRISDYGLKPLWKYAEQLIKAEDPKQKIQYIDQMLNVVHMRSDLAENFIQGGTGSLDALFSGEQEREYEVHRPM